MRHLPCLWRGAPRQRIARTLLLLALIAAMTGPMAQRSPPIVELVTFATLGPLFDEVVKIPRNGRGAYSLEIVFADEVPGRYDQEGEALSTPEMRRRLDRWETVHLLKAAGYMTSNPSDMQAGSLEELQSLQYDFALKGIAYQLHISFTPIEEQAPVRYVPGKWIFVLANPRSLVLRHGAAVSEHINLSEVPPYPSGFGGTMKMKPLIAFKGLSPGKLYRLKIINLSRQPIPAGISAALIFQQSRPIK